MRRAIPLLLLAILITSPTEVAMVGPTWVCASPGGGRSKVDALAQQAQVRAQLANEDVIKHLESMADLQVKYAEKVVQMVDQGRMDAAQGERLLEDLSETMQDLSQRASDLRKIKDAQERSRRRRGFFAALGRFFKGVGRFIGRTIGGVLYTTGKLARFAIEDLAPALIMEKVKAIVEGKINMLIEKLRGRIGTEAFDILVEVVKAIRKGKRGSSGDTGGQNNVEFYDDYCNVTIHYDLSTAYNPWQGGIHGYGPIDYLLECIVRAYLYEEKDLQHAEELAGEAENRRGFTQFGTKEITDALPAGTVPLSPKSGGRTFSRETPHSGSLEVSIEYPYTLKYPSEKKIYYYVFLSEIRYAAFGGYWKDVSYIGPVEIEVGNGS